MKILLIKGIVAAAFAALSFVVPDHPVVRVSADEDAIKKVIIAETQAFWDKDFSTLADSMGARRLRACSGMVAAWRRNRNEGLVGNRRPDGEAYYRQS